MTVLVFGGSGFIGSKVVECLTKNNVETLSYDIIASNFTRQKAKWIRADILELSSIERLFYEYEVDTVVHLVGLPAINYCEKNPQFSFMLNVVSVQNALEAMRIADIERIIFASSASVYGSHHIKPIKETDEVRPNTVYGHHKLMAEQVIKSYNESYGIKYVIFRLFNVYGGNPQFGKDVISIFIRRALMGEPLIVKGPRKFRDFVHVNDVTQSFLSVIENSRINDVTINIGSGERTSLRELAEMVKVHFPNVEVIEELAPDDGTGLQADISLARSLLSFEPRNPKEGINAHIVTYARKRDDK